MKTEIENYLNAINNAYVEFGIYSDPENLKKFQDSIQIEEGREYIRVLTGSCVHSFIVKKDGPKFKKGDVLKAASWKAPAKNFVRANIYDVDSYASKVLWSGIF